MLQNADERDAEIEKVADRCVTQLQVRKVVPAPRAALVRPLVLLQNYALRSFSPMPLKKV